MLEGYVTPLHPNGDTEKESTDCKSLPSHKLAVVHLGLCRPVEELDNILGHLGGGSRSAIVVLHKTVIQHTGHGNASTREVGVEVQARLHDSTGRRLIRVASQQGEDVVAATVAGLDHKRKIRRQSTIVGGAGGLVILVGRRQVVGKLAGTLLNLTLVVRLGVVLVLLGETLGLVHGHDVANQGPVGDTLERVAGSAHLTVDLETAAKRAMIVSLEGLLMLPWVFGGVETVKGLPSVCALAHVRYGPVSFIHFPSPFAFHIRFSLTLLRQASWRAQYGQIDRGTRRRNRRRWQQHQTWWRHSSTMRRIRRSSARRHCAVDINPSALKSSTPSRPFPSITRSTFEQIRELYSVYRQILRTVAVLVTELLGAPKARVERRIDRASILTRQTSALEAGCGASECDVRDVW